MSGQEVTYSTLRFLQSSPESQNTLRTDATQKPRKADGKGIHFKQLESPIFYALLNFSCKLCGHWSCLGVKCYYFVKEFKDWKGCKQMCQSHRSSLLKIDDYDELKFLQSQVCGDIYWIGLSYNGGEGKWKWTDNGTSGIDTKVMGMSPKGGECAFLTTTRIEHIDCSKTFYCICERRMDRLVPALLYGNKNR
uniref:C-type lectin domain-containing protein n=1 Tax=Castor canadensis TaxID=51338 RepID=A0A8C0XUF1_CASCN